MDLRKFFQIHLYYKTVIFRTRTETINTSTIYLYAACIAWENLNRNHKYASYISNG